MPGSLPARTSIEPTTPVDRRRIPRRPRAEAPDDAFGAVVMVLRTTCERDPALLAQLAGAGLRVCVVPDAAQAVAVVRSLAPAVVLLDVRYGEASALAACPQLKRTPNVTVIVLAQAAQTPVCTLGLELGADDFLVHPGGGDVASRIRAVVRRAPLPGAPAQGLALDEPRHVAMLDGRTLPLTPAEFRLLVALAAAHPRVLSRVRLLEAAGGRTGVAERSIDSLIHHLRRKLATVRPGQQMVRATYGTGYSLHVERAVAVPEDRPSHQGGAARP
jgi:two-component system, OmpR family, response regulator BaeR